MNHAQTIDRITREMMVFDQGDAKRIQHFLKVHRLVQLIGRMENLDPDTQFKAECAAVVHDIGIHPAEAKYGDCSGKLQEQEGPAPARTLLERLELEPSVIDRVCYLVGHHHTYQNITGLDYQILVEADFLVNLFEDGVSKEGALHAKEMIFKTNAGKKLFELMYESDR